MFTKKNIFISSVMVFVIWLIIIFVGISLQVGELKNLGEIVGNRIVYSFIIAPLFLLLFAYFYNKDFNFGISKPNILESLKLIILPLAFILIFLGLRISEGYPALGIIAILFINTMLVGISEELMFRGILFEAIKT